MKNPICITCETPLKIKRKNVHFRCMCDDEVRIVPLELAETHTHIRYLDDENAVSRLFIKEFLTTSIQLVE
jgi:hypothetical protein